MKQAVSPHTEASGLVGPRELGPRLRRRFARSLTIEPRFERQKQVSRCSEWGRERKCAGTAAVAIQAPVIDWPNRPKQFARL